MARASSSGRVNCGQWPVGRSTYSTSRIFANSRTGAGPCSIHSRSIPLVNSVARVLANYLSVAAAESVPAHEADDLRAIIRHARIPRERAAEFWERVFQLAYEFMQLPRSGETVYGFVAGFYPTKYPTLPDQDDDPAGTADRPDLGL